MNVRVSIMLVAVCSVCLVIAGCSETAESPVSVEQPSFTHREGHNPGGGGGGGAVESLNALSGVLTLVAGGGTVIDDNGVDEITITTFDGDHAALGGVLPDQHHARYTDDEARAAVGAVGGAIDAVYDYGTSSSSSTARTTGVRVAHGIVTVSGGNATIQNLPFSATPSCVVTRLRTTDVSQGIQITSLSASTLVIRDSENTNDAIPWICIGQG